jgi:serine/threonine protein kinase
MTWGIGSRVADRYLLEELIGRGGMADVYRATDLQLHRGVAVKVLREQVDDESGRLRFAAEARTVAQLNHPAIVTLLDAGLGGEEMFLVMELVGGTTLGQRLASGPLSNAEATRIGRTLADGLAHAHAAGVVHRDVKPGNVLLGHRGRALLADFGIAQLVDSVTRHTAVGQAIGSPAYLAPEQVTGGDLTGAADVYALGLMLLEALTGERPFTGTTTEVVHARLTRSPDVPSTLGAPWVDLLSAMTAMDPADRPTAERVSAVLAGGALEETAPFDVVDPTEVLTEVGPPTRRPRRAAALAVAAIVLVVLLGWLLSSALRDGGSPGPAAPATETSAPTAVARPTLSPSPSATRSATKASAPAPAPAPKHGKKHGGKGPRH